MTVPAVPFDTSHRLRDSVGWTFKRLDKAMAIKQEKARYIAVGVAELSLAANVADFAIADGTMRSAKVHELPHSFVHVPPPVH